MYVSERPFTAYLVCFVFVANTVLSRTEYLGCYIDEPSPRKLAGAFEDFPISLTPRVCMNTCRDKGYPYAGLQYSSQCFCGDQMPSDLDKKPECECNLKCSGDRSENCGGLWRNSVYESGFTEALINDSLYEYLGCFIDQEPRELGGHYQEMGNDNSPEVCVNLCKVRGFAYAGLQYRTQCFCGDQEPKPEKLVDQYECTAKCPGDKRFNCGGTWRQNVYKTGKSAFSMSAYLGCYVDQPSPRKLAGDLEDFPVSLTPGVCMNACRDKGYPYAGVQYGSQCFCGDQRPSVSDKRSESDCNLQCVGDRSQSCGGYWRNSIYNSGFADALISDSSYEYLGCFIDQEERELQGYFQDMGYSNSPEACVNLCKAKGFAYAGLQYRTQCFCGDQDPKPEKLVDQYECTAKCPGDKRFNCGATWRQNVYKTGTSGVQKQNHTLQQQN